MDTRPFPLGEPDDFARRLRELQAQPQAVHRDRLIFLAGQQSALPGAAPPAASIQLWRWLTGLSTLAACLLGLTCWHFHAELAGLPLAQAAVAPGTVPDNPARRPDDAFRPDAHRNGHGPGSRIAHASGVRQPDTAGVVARDGPHRTELKASPSPGSHLAAGYSSSSGLSLLHNWHRVMLTDHTHHLAAAHTAGPAMLRLRDELLRSPERDPMPQHIWHGSPSTAEETSPAVLPTTGGSLRLDPLQFQDALLSGESRI
jgi:hypothetical protein